MHINNIYLQQTKHDPELSNKYINLVGRRPSLASGSDTPLS